MPLGLHVHEIALCGAFHEVVFWECSTAKVTQGSRKYAAMYKYLCACRTMQQSYNFTQLYDTLVGEHGVLVWRSAFDGTRVLTTFSQRRLEMRRTFNDVIHAQRV